MIRIALTIPYLPPYVFGADTRKIYGDVSVGGAETWGWDFAQALRREGFRVDLYTADVPALGGGWLEVEGLRVFRASVIGFVDIVPILGPDFGAELAAGEYDVYQFSLFAHRNFCEMMEIAKARGSPTVFSHHGCGIITPEPEDRRRIMHALSSVDVITAPSISSLEHYDNTWIRRKLTVLSNGVDTRRFQPDAWRGFAPSRAAFRAEYMGGNDRPVILFVGRLLPHKGILFLLEALSDLLTRPSPLRPRVVLGGTGDQREELERWCGDRGLAIGDDVVFKGFVPDDLLPAFYGAADVFVLPSTRKGYHGETFMEPEAFGLVLTEAMACGTPCVANDIPGVNSVISHGVNGLLVEEGSAKSLADALSRTLADARLHEILRLGGLHTANSTFNYDRIAARFRTMVERITALRRLHLLQPLRQANSPKRLVFLAPSTTQFYSGQGRHLFEVARLLIDSYDIEVVTDDFVYGNLRPLLDFGEAFPVRVSVLRGLPPDGTLDPTVPDLRTHLSLEPEDAILCPIGWANTFLAEAVLEERRSRLIAFVPHYQPTATVPVATGVLKERLEGALDTLLRESDIVYAISREEVAMLDGRCGGEVRVALHGVNPDLFRTLPTRKEPLALFVGDLREPRKRLSLTLEVFREIHHRHPEFRLLIVGKCDDLEGLRRELPSDIADAVSVSGYVPDDSLVEYYTRATLLINTASYEAFCIPLIEAMACATIPLVTCTGGVPSVIDDGVTGFLLDPDDPCSSLDRVFAVLADRERLQDMRRAATRAVFSDFRWSTSAEVFRSGLEAAQKRRVPDRRPVPASAQRLRVLVVNDYFTPELVGGAEVYLHLLVADMAQRAEVTVVRHARRASQTRINGATVMYQPYDQPRVC
jgi:glycosyltransferase involved in cell wall biosynthesis